MLRFDDETPRILPLSPLRPTSTSSARHAISPVGVLLCALATLVMVPVLLASGASSQGDEVAVVAVADTSSASDLEAEIEIDDLFAAGARVEAVPEAPVAPPEADEAARGLSAAIASSVGAGASLEIAAAEPQQITPDGATSSNLAVEAPASAPREPVSTTPPVTAPPTTAPPATAPPVTAPPETTPPETTPPPVAEAPQAAEPVVAAPGAPTAEQWAALRQCESSGSYSIVSSNGRYHGAYQFNRSTWDGLAAQVGRSDLVGVAPSQAAPSDQDALALLLWQQRGNQPWPHCGRHLPAGP